MTATEHYKNGMGLFAQQDFQGALAAFASAVELDPQLADAHQSMAHCHERLGDLDAALACAQQAAAIQPDDPFAHMSLSILYQRRGNIAAAETEKATAARLQNAG